MVLGDDALRMFGKGSIPMQHLGSVSGAELLKVRLDVPRTLSRWSQE
jgi:hypothetical protein